MCVVCARACVRVCFSASSKVEHFHFTSVYRAGLCDMRKCYVVLVSVLKRISNLFQNVYSFKRAENVAISDEWIHVLQRAIQIRQRRSTLMSSESL